MMSAQAGLQIWNAGATVIYNCVKIRVVMAIFIENILEYVAVVHNMDGTSVACTE
jgi:hypothetical protein